MVTLMGTVESFAEKHAAGTVTLRVKAVAEEIEVILPLGTKRGDAEIAQATIDCLACNVSVAKDAVKVAAAKGWLVLTGEVRWQLSA